MSETDEFFKRASALVTRLEKIFPASDEPPKMNTTLANRWRRRGERVELQEVKQLSQVRLDDLHLTAALTSDAFYLMHDGSGIPGDAFHKEHGIPAGYVDGSVHLIEGRNDLLLTAAASDSNNAYWRDTDGDGIPEPPSMWGLLDVFGEN